MCEAGWPIQKFLTSQNKKEKLVNHEKPNFGGKEGISNFHIFSLLFLHASIKVDGGVTHNSFFFISM